MNYYLDTGILDILRPYLALKPVSVYKKINQSIDEKKFGDALELVDSAIKSGKKDLDLVIYKAMILSDLNRNKESLEFLNDQIEISQIDEENQLYTLYFFVLGFSSMTLGEYKNAFDIVKDVFKLYPDHPISHALKAVINGYSRIYGFDGEREDGFSDLENAITLESYESNKARYFQLKSQFLLESNNYEEALESIHNAIALSPKILDFYNSKIRFWILYLMNFLKVKGT
jgi:tetratricopeptide (TPR) repeat protein